MKTLASILLALCLAACATQPVTSTGEFLISKFAVNGQVEQTWTVRSYTETEFPRRVTFTHDGQTIVLDSSYQIDEFTTP